MNDTPIDVCNISPVPRLALTIHDAAQSLSLSPRTVEELVRVRQLRAVRVGRRVLLPVVELERFLAEPADDKEADDEYGRAR